MNPRCTHIPKGRAADAANALRAHVPELRTARLILRAPRIGDLAAWTPAYLAEWAEPGDAEERAWEAFSAYAACWLLHGHGLWTVTHRADKHVVGFVHLGLEWDDDEPELGYIITAEHRRKGYGAEACAAARDHGLALLGEGGFVSYVDPDNVASNGLAAKLGGARDPVAEAAIADDIHIWRYGVA
ncbi:MAG: GNAT family N-acetyltransferase [Pseudomonadota bacterium]